MWWHIQDATRRYGNRICTFHLKDIDFINGEKVTVPFGLGLVDVDRYIDFINKLKPYTYATFEATKEDKLDGALHALHQAETKSNKIIIQ